MESKSPIKKTKAAVTMLRLLALSICVFTVSMDRPAVAGQKRATNGPPHDKMLYIEGTSDLFANFKGRATENAIHIQSRMGGSIWKEQSANSVTLYNNENKVYFVQTVKAYLLDLNQDFLPISIDEWETPTQTVFEGRPAKVYKGFAKLGKLGRQHVADVTCIDNTYLSPSAHRIWCRFLGLNRFDIGIPVSLMQKRAPLLSCDTKVMKLGSPRWCRALTTNKIKEVPIDKNGFSVKANWKQAKDKAGLLFSKDGSLRANEIDDFFRSDQSKF